MGRIQLGAVIAAASLTVGEAQAGAWIAPEDGQDIFTLTHGQDAFGGYQTETDYFWERPLSRRFSLVAHPRMESGAAYMDGWRADADLGVKAAFLRGDDGAAAVQAAAVWRSDAEPGCAEMGGELRLMGGMSRGWGARSAFINLEAATRLHGGGCSRQRLDLTAGFSPHEDWLGLAQTFADFSPDGEAVIRTQASVVRFGEGRRGLQLGLRLRLDGDAREPAIVLGWWGDGRD